MAIFDRQFELLTKELDLIDSAIRQIDGITKDIKNWAIVTWTASIGITLNDDKLNSVIFATAIIPLLFWIVDASYRRVQRTFILRSRELGKFINSAEFLKSAKEDIQFDFPLMKMRKKESGWKKNSIVGVMLFKTVKYLYFGLIGASVLIWVFARYTVK